MADKDTLHDIPVIKHEADSVQQDLAMIPDNSPLDPHTITKAEAIRVNGTGAVSDQPFPLMKLPVEIRRMIFEELLIMPSPIMFRNYVAIDGKGVRYRFPPYATILPVKEGSGLRGAEDPFNAKESEIIRQNALLNVFLASKIIYRETVPLYYGHNTFEFHEADMFKKFAVAIGPECRWQLARVNIWWTGGASGQVAKVMLDCVGLRKLTLRIFSWSIVPCTAGTPSVSRLCGMRDLLRVRGLETLQLNIAQPFYCYTLSCPDHQTFREDIAGSTSIAAMKEQLEVLKQPLDANKLKRQEAKDFPVKARRTVFGEANVVTR